MDAEAAEHCFEPFFTTKDRAKGTGLGPGRGARGHHQRRGPRARPPPARALLVEDEEELRTLARRTLESHGYSVVSASTGSEALAIARRDMSDIDLLVTDVIMPGMGGPELARRLAELDGRQGARR